MQPEPTRDASRGTGAPGNLPPPPDNDHAWALSILDSLLYSVSHDLRSPLLTMTFSADLIEEVRRTESGSADGDVEVALGPLRQGAADLERMLQSLTQLSRARRRVLEPASTSLGVVLGGYIVSTEVPDLHRHTVYVDPLLVREVLDACGDEGALSLRVTLQDGYAHVAAPVPSTLDGLLEEASPLAALATSLHRHAGTAVETLAVQQVLLERQGAQMTVGGGELLLGLPTKPPTRPPVESAQG